MTVQPPNPYGPPGDPSQAPGTPPAGQPAPPPGYQVPHYPYGYAHPPPQRTNTMAILALVLAFVFAPVAIILGHLARKQIRETGEDGDGLALAGMIIGYVFTGLTVAFCVGYVVFFIIMIGTVGATSV